MSSKLLFIESMDILSTIPQYHALIIGFLVLWIVWILAKRRYGNVRTSIDGVVVSSSEPNNNEVEKKLSDWSPDSLINDITEKHSSLRPKRLISRIGKRIIIDHFDCLNLGTHNYLGFSENNRINDSAVASVKKYGVGSCGPRGFYGTVDVHLELEERLAKFMETEEAIVYSYGFSTVASAIPAYCKRRDIVFVDEAVNFAVQKGLEASRSIVRYFSHNDTDDLERLLKKQATEDVKNLKRASAIRRFLIVEGIYINTGLVCPLPRLIELCDKYKLRIFIDESISFGTLGARGRGVTEHFGVPRCKIDMIMGSLELSLSSIGGFCVGSSFVIEHQRLSGLGYCFSASLPPLLTSAAITALDIVESEPEIFETLRKNCLAVDAGLRNVKFFVISGIPESPVKHAYLRDKLVRDEENLILERISEKCMENGLAIVKAAYLDAERDIPRASLRICVSVNLNEDDIKFFLETLENCAKQVLSL